MVRNRSLDALREALDQTNRTLVGTSLDRFSRVLPGLLIGPQHTRAGLRRLKMRGVTAILNARAESDDRALGRATERYLHLPVIDQKPPRSTFCSAAAISSRRNWRTAVSCMSTVIKG